MSEHRNITEKGNQDCTFKIAHCSHRTYIKNNESVETLRYVHMPPS